MLLPKSTFTEKKHSTFDLYFHIIFLCKTFFSRVLYDTIVLCREQYWQRITKKTNKKTEMSRFSQPTAMPQIFFVPRKTEEKSEALHILVHITHIYSSEVNLKFMHW